MRVGKGEVMLVNRRDKGAQPTPFSPARAKELVKELASFTQDGDRSSLTPGEDNFVRQVWETLPGHVSWFGALSRIARG